MESGGGGFTQLHVSGLPADCEDASVETALRRILSTQLNITNAADCFDADADAAEPSEGQVYGCENACGFEGSFAAVLAHEKSCGGVAAAAVAPAAKAEEVNDKLGRSEDSSTAQAAAEAKDGQSENDTPAKEGCAGYPVADPTTDLQPGAPARQLGEECAEAVETPQPETRVEAECGERAEDLDLELDPEGAFVSCTVVRNKDTHVCKGYCFLSFSSVQAAEKAMETLNAGVIVAGSVVKAQISQAKERHAKPKDPTESLNDLRLRRQRYANYGSKKQQLGHVTCSSTTGKAMSKTGKINVVGGTRGGKQQVFENDQKSTKSGFACAK